MMGEVVSAGSRAEAPRDFLPQLRIAFGLGIGEGHIRIAQEAQYIVPTPMEAQQEIVPDASRLAAAALGATKRHPADWEARAECQK
jgi:hypothetical protein